MIIDREMTDDNIATGTYTITVILSRRDCDQKKRQLTSLCPTREIIRATFRHPAPLAVSIDIAIDNLCVNFRRVESHEGVKCSEL
jgi:hypothetical protein